MAAVLLGAAAIYRYQTTRRRTGEGWSASKIGERTAGGIGVRVSGNGEPAVLLLHGLTGSGRYWGAEYDKLGDHHRLVVPDLVGFGRSAGHAGGYSPDDHVAAIVACLDELGIDEPVVVGAHSLGCLIALRLAATHPTRVAAIVGFGPPLYADEASARNQIRHSGPMARLIVLPGPLAQRACGWVCAHRSLAARIAIATHPSLPPPVAADGVIHTWTSYSQTLQQVILAAGAAAWLRDITVPVRFVAGEKDPVVDHAFLDRIATRHANVTVQRWPGRHNLPLEVAPRACSVIAQAAMAARPRRRMSLGLSSS